MSQQLAVSSSPRVSRRAGLTLIEIVVSVAILSLLLSGLFAAMASAMRADVFMRERQAASEAAAAQLDQFLTNPALAWTDSKTYFDVSYRTVTGGAGALQPWTTLPTAPGGWTTSRVGMVDVDVDPDGAGANLMRITVSVAWLGADHAPPARPSFQRLDMVSMRAR